MSVIEISINGRKVPIDPGISVAAALIRHGLWHFRTSESGAARAPICAMGICFECRVTIDGRPHRRACMETCRAGMEVETGA